MMESDKRFVMLAINKLTHPITGLHEGKDYDTFISLMKWFTEKDFLTPKQLELLEEIFDRN